MANKAKYSTPSSENFDPTFDLVKEEALDTLIINLPEFKKEQLRVKVDRGVLKISGERPTNPDGTKRIRFLKEIETPEDCDVNGIRAKFVKGHLQITMPKKITSAAPEVAQKQHDSTSACHQSELDGQMRDPQGSVSDNRVFEYGSVTRGMLGSKRLILGLGIATVTMVAIGVFVAYKHESTTSFSYFEELGLF